jgi:NTE family protein
VIAADPFAALSSTGILTGVSDTSMPSPQRRPSGVPAAVFASVVALGIAGFARAADDRAPAIANMGAASGVAAPAAAAARPRIGLVLSGGGARGAAHIGVLKVIEELGVPIDAIAGTSMGAVIGGLYASGMSVAEIESVMNSVNWQAAFSDQPPRSSLTFRRKAEDRSFLVRLPLGLRSGDFLLPRGLIQGQKLTQLLRSLTLPVAGLSDFDRLPTAFRAVATDLESGNQAVLASGDLVTAMRASVSAPGVFTPVEVDGRLLVDGGLVDNLPVQAARDMGVDRLIVVDVGFPLQSRPKLSSVGSISNQMLAILIRRGSVEQRRSLTNEDVLIEPPLGDASSFDFSMITRAIGAGEQAARAMTPALAALALAPDDYRRWLASRAAARVGVERIAAVEVGEGEARYGESLRALFEPLIGSAPDTVELERRVTVLYGQGNVESLDYRFEPLAGGDAVLQLEARRNSWGPNYVRFGLRLQDDFEGNSSFDAAARLVLSELTTRGAEWVWDLQVGESPRIATEFFLPLDFQGRWFLAPHAQLAVRNVPLLTNDGQRLAEFRLRSTDYGIDGGLQFGNWGEWRAGASRESGEQRLRLGSPSLTGSSYDVEEYFTRFSYDQLDDVNFPRQGQLLTLEWRAERNIDATVDGADVVTLDALIARSWGRNSGVFWVSGGSTVSGTPSLRTLFPLGGFLNLSGLPPDSLSGSRFGIARGLYLRKIGRGGEGFLNVPTYVGFSAEVGNVWNERQPVTLDSTRKHGSLFLGLDTLLGPVYLGAGFGDRDASAYYLFLGRAF